MDATRYVSKGLALLRRGSLLEAVLVGCIGSLVWCRFQFQTGDGDVVRTDTLNALDT